MNVKNLALGIGIIVVFALALGYGLEAFYDSPDYNNFCEDVVVPQTIKQNNSFTDITQEQCLSFEGAKWVSYEGRAGLESGGYCDYYAGCQKEYDNARDAHSWKVFLISLIVGVIAIIVGYTVLSIEPVGSALIGSGIWAFFYGGLINWRNFGEIWRFVILFVILIILIWLGVSLNRKKESAFKKWFKGFGFGKK